MTIHERVTGLNVGTVLDRSENAYKDRMRPPRADGNVVQILEIPDHRVDRHHQVADANVARRTERFTWHRPRAKRGSPKVFMGLVRPENNCSSGLDP